MSAIIKTENLRYIYGAGLPGATVALDGIDLSIEQGEFVGVIGPTGCGKSTLITHFNGLNRPTEGKIFIDGTDIWAKPEAIRQYRFLVGLVFQYPYYQLFEETVVKDIAYGPRNMGLSAVEVEERVMQAAAFVGLAPETMKRSPFELSGGQKRRVAIAGILAMRPKVLVLDEPAAGLDPEGREMILSQIKKFHKETHTTVVLVSHSMEDIAKYADRVLVLQAGKVAMYDTTERVFARADELVQLGLSVPQVTKIFLKMRQLGVNVPADVYTVKYAKERILEALAAGKGAGQC